MANIRAPGVRLPGYAHNTLEVTGDPVAAARSFTTTTLRNWDLPHLVTEVAGITGDLLAVPRPNGNSSPPPTTGIRLVMTVHQNLLALGILWNIARNPALANVCEVLDRIIDARSSGGAPSGAWTSTDSGEWAIWIVFNTRTNVQSHRRGFSRTSMADHRTGH